MTQGTSNATAGKALVASGAVLVVVGVVLAIVVSPWGSIAAVVGVFDILIGQLMMRGTLGTGGNASSDG
jgi:hypothetical protein